MPLKSGMLTPQERSFAKHYAATGDQVYAGQKAGYASPAGACMAIQRPAVREEVERLFGAELQGEILPLALKRHRQILSDPKSTGPTLSRAIELAYKFGFSKRENSFEDLEPYEMTAAQLHRTAAEGARLIEGLAQRIEAEPEPEHLENKGTIFD